MNIRSNFKVRAHYGVLRNNADIVWIYDIDDGSTSVTNDAEAVVAEVHSRYGDRRIIYRDSEGRWDELAHDHGVFTYYRPAPGLDPETYFKVTP